MSDKLREVFATCEKQNRPAFVAYLMAGYQNSEDTVPTMRALQDGGADVLELGVPFTDPIADGYLLPPPTHTPHPPSFASLRSILFLYLRVCFALSSQTFQWI